MRYMVQLQKLVVLLLGPVQWIAYEVAKMEICILYLRGNRIVHTSVL